MIDKVWAIKSVEEKVASNNNPYIVVIIDGDDGKEHKNTIFDPSMFQVFKKNPFVKVQLDKPEGASRWQVKSAVAVADALPPAQEPAPLLKEHQEVVEKAVESVPPKPPKPSNEADERIRSMAVSYAKDLVNNKVIEATKMFSYAEAIYRYIKADITVTDEAVFKELMGKHFSLN